MLLCKKPYSPIGHLERRGPGCSLPSNPEASLSLMYQISDVCTSSSFSSVHSLLLLLTPQKIGCQIFRPNSYASCKLQAAILQAPSTYGEYFILSSLQLPTPSHFLLFLYFLENTSYKGASSDWGPAVGTYCNGLEVPQKLTQAHLMGNGN